MYRYVVLITNEGVREVEQSMRNPKSSTRFSPHVIYNVTQHIVNSVFGSQDIGGQGNVATVHQTVTNTAILDAIQRLRAAVDELPADKKAEAAPFIDELVKYAKDLPKMAVGFKSLLMTIGTIVGAERAPLIADILSLLPSG